MTTQPIHYQEISPTPLVQHCRFCSSDFPSTPPKEQHGAAPPTPTCPTAPNLHATKEGRGERGAEGEPHSRSDWRGGSVGTRERRRPCPKQMARDGGGLPQVLFSCCERSMSTAEALTVTVTRAMGGRLSLPRSRRWPRWWWWWWAVAGAVRGNTCSPRSTPPPPPPARRSHSWKNLRVDEPPGHLH